MTCRTPAALAASHGLGFPYWLGSGERCAQKNVTQNAPLAPANAVSGSRRHASRRHHFRAKPGKLLGLIEWTSLVNARTVSPLAGSANIARTNRRLASRSPDHCNHLLFCHGPCSFPYVCRVAAHVHFVSRRRGHSFPSVRAGSGLPSPSDHDRLTIASREERHGTSYDTPIGILLAIPAVVISLAMGMSAVLFVLPVFGAESSGLECSNYTGDAHTRCLQAFIEINEKNLETGRSTPAKHRRPVERPKYRQNAMNADLQRQMAQQSLTPPPTPTRPRHCPGLLYGYPSVGFVACTSAARGCTARHFMDAPMLGDRVLPALLWTLAPSLVSVGPHLLFHRQRSRGRSATSYTWLWFGLPFVAHFSTIQSHCHLPTRRFLRGRGSLAPQHRRDLRRPSLILGCWSQ